MNKFRMHKFTLSFCDNPELEQEFHEDQLENSREFVKTSGMVGMTTLASFGAVDYIVFNSIYYELWLIRYFFVGLILSAYIYSFQLNKKCNYFIYAGFVGPVLGGLSIPPMVELINTCIDSNEGPGELKNIKINNHLKSPLICKIDIFKTREVIENILSNALKYSNPNSKIDIKYDDDKMYHKLMMQDYGQGIKEEELPKIFDEFTKLSSVPTAGESSSGLGMALSKKLMEIQKGDIVCESRYQEGSQFTVLI